MHMRYLILVLISVLLQSACASSSTVAMSPAVLSNSSPEATWQISQAIGRVLKIDSTSLKLTPDALTQTNQLSIERNTQPPQSMPELNGRLMQAPVVHRFSLFKRADECYLVYQKTGESQSLNGISCKYI